MPLKVEKLSIKYSRKKVLRKTLIHLTVLVCFVILLPLLLSNPNTLAYVDMMAIIGIVDGLIRLADDYIRLHQDTPVVEFTPYFLIINDVRFKRKINKTSIKNIEFKIDEEPLETEIIYEVIKITFEELGIEEKHKVKLYYLDWSSDYADWINKWYDDAKVTATSDAVAGQSMQL